VLVFIVGYWIKCSLLFGWLGDKGKINGSIEITIFSKKLKKAHKNESVSLDMIIEIHSYTVNCNLLKPKERLCS